MGTAGNSGKTTGKSGATPGSAAGHTARTKVALPAGVEARRDGPGAKGPSTRRPPAPPKPWYRQGRFWFAVIALEALVALALSVHFMPSDDDVSLDGADIGQFCLIVKEDQSFSGSAPVADPNQVAVVWGARTATLRAMQPYAPEDVRPDIDELAGLTQGVQDLALDVQKRNLSDPSYDGSTLLEAKQAQVDSSGALASRRLSLAVLKGCGVDLAARAVAPTTTSATLPPTTMGPVVGPTVVTPTAVSPTTPSSVTAN